MSDQNVAENAAERSGKIACRNMGSVDRLVRLALAAGLFIGAVFGPWWLAIPAVVLLVTAAIGWCPLYCPFRISTRCKPRPPAEA